jgi:DNA-binding CsgD family transcriptional regulator
LKTVAEYSKSPEEADTMDGVCKTSAYALRLRRAAEKKAVLQSAETAVLSAMGAKRLYHELQVHQIELEMQHLELQQSRQTLDLLLNQYATLYDFAPVSYMSLNRDGYVLKCNLAGAVLVGMARSEINGRPFAQFVAQADRPFFESFLEKVFSERPLETNCELNLLTKEHAAICVQLKAQADESGRECLLALVDAAKGNYTLSPARLPINVLSRRERETLKFVVECKTNSAIAGLMNVSPKSVETYRSRMMLKLGISNIPDLVRFALLCGVISLWLNNCAFCNVYLTDFSANLRYDALSEYSNK